MIVYKKFVDYYCVELFSLKIKFCDVKEEFFSGRIIEEI